MRFDAGICKKYKEMVDIFEAILYYVNIINKRIVTGNAGYTIL